jgi:hypothetical protein
MGALARNFFLPSDRFRPTRPVFSSRLVSISYGADNFSGEEVLIHTLQMIGFQSADLLDFVTSIFILHHSSDLPGLLPVVGMTSTVDTLSVLYQDLEATPINLSAVALDSRQMLITSIAKSLATLHSAGIPHCRIKTFLNSFFPHGNAFYLGDC